MIGLPPALRPWAELLELFPTELALGLGPWVQRLALGMGPLRARTAEGLSEPDGYDGLTRRGPYERLLASEWLLASELPEEFTRRAVMREHGFLRLAFREPAGSRRSVALFDAGPSQLGSPRIAHLAALIVLAQRARDAGAAFAWGFLQHLDTPLIEEVTPASVLRLLHARTAKEVSEEHLATWAEELGLREPDDVWLVGSTRVGALAGALGVSALVARDVLEPGARQVAVHVRRSRTSGTSLTLELPPPADCTRLLRDPFSAVAAPARVTGLGHPVQLLYGPTGRRLITRLADGSVAAHSIPNSPRTRVGRPRRFVPPRDERVVAVGWAGRLLVVTWHEERGLSLYGVLGRPLPVPGTDKVFRPPRGEEPVPPCHRILRPDGNRILFTDAAGGLFAVEEAHEAGFVVLAVGVRAYAPIPGGFAYVEAPGPDERLVGDPARQLVEWGLVQRAVPFEGEGGLRAFFGPDVVAVGTEPGRWQLIRNKRPVWLPLPEQVEVVGVLGTGNHELERTGLVLLHEDRRTLSMISIRGGRRWLTTLPGEVVQAQVHPTQREVAALTTQGEVVVYAIEQGRIVLRLVPGARPGTLVVGGPA